MLPSPSLADIISAVLWLSALLASCAATGFIARRRSETFSAWLSGGSAFGPVITGLALSATWMSGWACLGLMGITYAFGWSGMWLAGVWTLVGIIPCATIFGPRLRRKFHELKALTVPQLVGSLYNSKIVAATASVVYIVLLLVYSVGQYKAAATAWHVITGTPWELSVMIGASVTIAYMVLGGYTGTQWALAIQGLFMTVACYILAYVALSLVGGPMALNEKLALQDPRLIAPLRADLASKPNLQFATDAIGLTATLGLFVTMAIGFPHNVARFLGMRPLTRREVALMSLVIFVSSAIPWANIITGLSARAMFGDSILTASPAKADAAAPFVALASGPTVSGMYVAAVFAASLSTLAGMVLVMAGSFTRDVILLLRPGLGDRKALLLARGLVAVFALIPLTWVVVKPPDLLAYLMSGAAVGMGCIFFFVLAMTLYWRRAHRYGALACMAYGFIMTALGGYYVYTVNVWSWGGWWWATFIGCAITYVGFSLLGKSIEKKLNELRG
jgi:Na+/proline symporter